MNYTEEEILQATELYPALWMLQYELKTSNGLPFEFENHNFMWDIINDMSPLQVGLKPPQIGWSESLITKSFYVADKKSKDIIYTLPTATDRDDMVGAKVNRIIAQNPILQKMVKDHDTVEQKTVGDSIIHYRGTFSQKQAMMVSSSLNIHDEVDASDPNVITQYETRLMANPEDQQWRWYFSHPSLAGHGVDVYWAQSDKKEWFITCNQCKYEQILEWPHSIDMGRRAYVCKECKADIDDGVRCRGYWKATSQGIFSGYHISQLMCPWITAEKIIEAKNDPMKSEQYFYNYVLGLPYAASDDVITVEQVLNNVSSEFNSQEDRVMIGVDTGLPIHYTLMNKQGVFYYGKCDPPSANYDPYSELEGFLLRWPKSVIVSDQGGDLIGIRQLQARYPGRVYLCFYRKDRKTKEVITWGEHDELGKVTVDRNRMLQLIIEQLREGDRIHLNGTREEWKPFAEHFGNIFRIKEETPFGMEYKWERKGPDHFVHSLLYAMVGFDRFSGEPSIATDLDWMKGFKTGRTFPMQANDLRK